MGKFRRRRMISQRFASAAILGFCAMLGAQSADAGLKNGQAASVVVGQQSFTSATAAATRRGLFDPNQVGFDHFGNLWVADQCNSRLLQYRQPFSDGMAASVVIGEPDFTTTRGPGGCGTFPAPPATAATLFLNTGFAFDAYGDLWVTDTFDRRVLEFAPPFSNGMAAVLVIGQKDFTSQKVGDSAKTLGGTTGVAFDPNGDLWVADYDNSRIVEFTPPFKDGMAASLVIGQVDFVSKTCATTRSGLCRPTSIAFDYLGNLWAGDAQNNRILQFRPPFHTGMPASVVLGQKDFASKVASGGPSGLNFTPNAGDVGIGFGEHGDLWVADAGNNRVLEFKKPFVSGMKASKVLGQDTFDTSAAATTANGLWVPEFPAFDFHGNLWISDSNNSRVLEFKAGK